MRLGLVTFYGPNDVDPSPGRIRARVNSRTFDFVVMSFHNFIKISLAHLLGTQRNVHTYGDVLAKAESK